MIAMTKVQRPNDPDIGACLEERRRNRRISVRLGVSVRLPESPRGPAAVERTTTRNISPGDMCFESGFGRRLQAGDPVELDIEVPAEGPPLFAERRLQVKGRVVRVEVAGAADLPSAVAVIFERPPAFHKASAEQG